MGLRRALHDFRDLRRSVAELFDADAAAEQAASLAVTDAACRFSRQAKDVVDDKLTFSATLMRAGEVHAANRLLAEVERDVRDEEAALIETVNEVKVAQSIRRERMTRVRLARTLAVAMVGAGLLSFSAAGMALASFLQDRAEAELVAASPSPTRVAVSDPSGITELRTDRKRMKKLRIGDVKLMLTRSEFQRLQAATAGTAINAGGLADLLSSLPGPLADKLQEAMTVATAEAEQVTSSIEELAAEAPKPVERKKRKAARAAQEAEKDQADEAEEPAPEPTESPDEEPSEEPEDGGDEDKKDDGDEEEGPPLPVEP